jgi:phytoene/squalene synthetase
MGVIYRALLRAIEARRFRVFDRRIRLSTARRLALAAGVYLRAQLP